MPSKRYSLQGAIFTFGCPRIEGESTMEPLDIEAILKVNPKVEKKEIRGGRRRRVIEPQIVEGDPTSPYRGRRATSDDRMNWTERSVRRSR
jgi:hypothetical protein